MGIWYTNKGLNVQYKNYYKIPAFNVDSMEILWYYLINIENIKKERVTNGY